MAHRVIKNVGIALLVGLCLMGAVVTHIVYLQKGISSGVIRLHVIANSNTDFDQKLKLEVRDNITKYLSDMPEGDIDSAFGYINGNVGNIQKAAEETIALAGYDYPVRVNVGEFDFPTKYYGNMALPQGKYNAVRVEIGEAVGNNWFCVLFPPLCFSGDNASMPDSGKEQLKKVLPEEQYKMIDKSDTAEVQVKFRVLELFDWIKK